MRKELSALSFSHSIVHEATALVKNLPSDMDPKDLETINYACATVLRARIENARILAAQLSGDYNDISPRDPLFSGMAASGYPPLPGEVLTQREKTKSLGEIVELYLIQKNKHDFVDKTSGDVNRVMALAYSVVSIDKPIIAIDTGDIKKFRDLVATIPPNYTKIIANAGISAKIAAKQNKSGQILSLQTQEKYLRMFKSVFAWAVDEGYMDKLPGQKVKVAGL